LARGQDEIFKDTSESFERILIEAALKHAGGRKLDAAKKLGWGRNTLARRLKDLDLS
jgi:two-component system nitrogen regulation response regulator GlnG